MEFEQVDSCLSFGLCHSFHGRRHWHDSIQRKIIFLALLSDLRFNILYQIELNQFCNSQPFILQTYYLELHSTTSYAGHAFGALTGLLVGVFVLQNRKVEDWELIFQWIVLGLFGVLICICVFWHIIGTNFGWFALENWEIASHCQIE